MKTAAIALFVVLTSAAQQPAEPELHAKVLQLVELTGAKERLTAAMPQMLEEGVRAMQTRSQPHSPEFDKEYAKRMRARFSADAFLDVAVKVYERHFTAGEIDELIAAVKAQKAQKAPNLSPALQQKAASEMPAILGEIVGGCTELGARIGGEVGVEIQKEHPEYLLPPTAH